MFHLSIISGHERSRPLHESRHWLAAPREAELEGGAASEDIELVGDGLKSRQKKTFESGRSHMGHEIMSLSN